jgi:hypothetical protein
MVDLTDDEARAVKIWKLYATALMQSRHRRSKQRKTFATLIRNYLRKL